MTTVTDTFTGTDGSALSAIWTLGNSGTASVAQILSNAGLFRTVGGTAYNSAYAISRRLTTTFADFDATFEFWLPAAVEMYPKFKYRGVDSPLFSNNYALDLKDGSGTITLAVPGGVGTIGSMSLSIVIGTHYFVRVRAVGSLHKVKIWTGGFGSEPTTGGVDGAGFQISATDSSFLSAGYTGFSSEIGSASATRDLMVDNLTVATYVNLVQTDSTGLTDGATTSLVTGTNYTQAVTDSTGLTDTGAPFTFSYGDTYTDTTGATDGTTLDRATVATDTTGSSDTTATAAAVVYAATDGTGSTDATATTRGLVAADTTGLSDSLATSSGITSTATDTTGSTDTAATASTVVTSLAFTDTTGATDTQATNRTTVATDTTGASDTAGTAASIVLTVADDAGSSDATARAGSVNLIQSDTTGLTDVTNTSGTGTMTTNDTTGSTDAATLAASVATSASDTTGLVDTFALALSRVVTVDDFLNLTDTTTSSAAYAITDPAAGGDTLTSARAVTLDDLLAATDAATPALYTGTLGTPVPNPRLELTVSAAALVLTVPKSALLLEV